jgi:hypothetical protein
MDIKLQGESARILKLVSELTGTAEAVIVSKLLLDKYRIAKQNKFSLLLDLSPTKKDSLTACSEKLGVSLSKALLISIDELYNKLASE